MRSKPYLSDFSSSEGPGSGTIEVNPGGIMCPPFVVKYNSVRSPSFPCHSLIWSSWALRSMLPGLQDSGADALPGHLNMSCITQRASKAITQADIR